MIKKITGTDVYGKQDEMFLASDIKPWAEWIMNKATHSRWCRYIQDGKLCCDLKECGLSRLRNEIKESGVLDD